MHMHRTIIIIRVAFKSILRKNQGNISFLLCTILLMFIPTVFFNTAQSVLDQVERTHRIVFGNFTDIYYDTANSDNYSLDFSDNQLMGLLPDFHFERFGLFFTVYKQELNDYKMMNVGYADDEALSLAEVIILEGNLPKYNNEIALTQGITTSFGKKKIGEQIEIAESTYVISGIIQDFGHLWPRGELQIKNKIDPVNVFVSYQEANRILQKTGEPPTRQILIQRQLGISNSFENNSFFLRNVNNSLENKKKFNVPYEFCVLLYVTSIIIIFIVLSLNRRCLAERIKNYNLLGLIKSEIVFLIRFEFIFLSILGLFIGSAFGYGAAFCALKLLSMHIGEGFPIVKDISPFILLFIVMFIGICILVLFFSCHIVNGALTDKKPQYKKNYQKTKKINLFTFELWQKGRVLIFLFLLVVFAYSIISYGIFYGNYFTKDIFEAPEGTIPRDYDFQFIAHPQSSPPLSKGERAFYFTDMFEKIGASNEFVADILSEHVVKSVKAYKEVNKMNILLNENQVDDYIDAYDFYLDGNCNLMRNTGIIDFDFLCLSFDYKKDDILVGCEILTYPIEVLKALENSVVEGKINIDKIKSGEEVVLRVPAYTIKKMENEAIARVPVPYTRKDAYNSTTFKVGDEIHLSGILTDELINGPVTEKQVNSYYRHDINVKVGAIIRDTSGIYLSHGTVIGKPFSILGVDQTLKSMNIPATYSIVSIYTKDGYDTSELNKIIANYSYKVPCMKLQDWQADVKTYKVFNLMVQIFVITLLSVISFTTLVILMSQLYIKTQLSMKNYALLRINGLSYRQLVCLWILQVFMVFKAGCLIGIPVSFLIINIFGIGVRTDILHEILYYFPANNLLYVFIEILAIVTISAIPSLLYLNKYKDNIIFNI